MFFNFSFFPSFFLSSFLYLFIYLFIIIFFIYLFTHLYQRQILFFNSNNISLCLLKIFAAPDNIKSSLHLSGLDCSHFRYTGMGDLNTKTIEDVPDGIRFSQTMQVLELLGIGVELQNDLQRILAGILYLGQIPFLGDTDNSYIDPGSHSDALKCCDLLGLEQSAFYKNTTVRRIVTSEQEMLVSLSMDQASDGRDALAKDTYDRLFQWLVVAINDSTAADGVERSVFI